MFRLLLLGHDTLGFGVQLLFGFNLSLALHCYSAELLINLVLEGLVIKFFILFSLRRYFLAFKPFNYILDIRLLLWVHVFLARYWCWISPFLLWLVDWDIIFIQNIFKGLLNTSRQLPSIQCLCYFLSKASLKSSFHRICNLIFTNSYFWIDRVEDWTFLKRLNPLSASTLAAFLTSTKEAILSSNKGVLGIIESSSRVRDKHFPNVKTLLVFSRLLCI